MARFDTQVRQWGSWSWGLGLFVLTVAGCGAPTASVSGNVTFKGRPVPAGTILFHGEDGRVEYAPIQDGKYAVRNAPLGPVRVTVKSHAAQPGGLPSSGKPPSSSPDDGANKVRRDENHVPIPPRYRDPGRSGLAYTIRAGEQTYDVELKP